MDIIKEAELLAVTVDTDFAQVTRQELVTVISALVGKLKAADEVAEAAKEVTDWEYDNLGCGYDGCDLSDFGCDVRKLDEALAKYKDQHIKESDDE